MVREEGTGSIPAVFTLIGYKVAMKLNWKELRTCRLCTQVEKITSAELPEAVTALITTP